MHLNSELNSTYKVTVIKKSQIQSKFKIALQGYEYFISTKHETLIILTK